MVAVLLFLGGLGAVSALLLGIAARVFYVKEDPLVVEIENALPGANCGGCGYAGCHACAEAIARGEAAANACVVGGFETTVQVAASMGVKVEAREPQIAATSCTYGTGEADLVYLYNGARDCQAAVALFGGGKLCPLGCIGLGSCVKACKFDALQIGPDRLPRFNPKKCVACGACVKACPKQIIQLTSSSDRLVREYTTAECTAPCMRGCPTGIDIPRYIAAIRDGRPQEALRIIKETCPLPLVCGRICPAPCELQCRRNLAGDEPVGINPLKRYVADYEMRTGRHINPYANAPSGRRVAVVGGGAEGLTAAYYLARLGHATTLLEARDKLGGILRHVIAPGRLPEGVLEHEIESILAMGVEARTGQLLGRDATIGSLIEREGCDAVLLATGGYDSRKLLLSESERVTPVPGLHLVVDFLGGVRAGRAPAVGRRVVIVGGESRSREAAELCRRAGAREVLIVVPGPAERMSPPLGDAAALEGVEVRAATIVTALFGAGDRLVGLRLETAGADGCPAVELREVDTILLASGRIPELVFRPVLTPERAAAAGGGAEAEVYPDFAVAPTWATAEVYRTLASLGAFGVFSSPEPGRTSDAGAVVRAILSGRRMVRGVHAQVMGRAIESIPDLAVEADEVLDVREVFGVSVEQRHEPGDPLREPGTEADWAATAELSGLGDEEARAEARRCLQCGLICYQKAM
ncbi:MAG: RnfABCDGE type electron transport complex subunit B [Candidatus Eisenbacteria bacterium]|uniref:Ion-translocating oxidoreductase complex subunit B n=1 Tax=Eiseniibacteriota bacterium TaxID=2212470 RepID=A0A937XAM5_UNCEI|nr:RnfABCDGE type electron transport complex subunit B [Candidatus Eisenbacteria bacterium]